MTEFFLEIHDITFPVPNDTLNPEVYLPQLGNREHSRYLGFSHHRHRAPYLLSRIFLRQVLSKITNTPPEDLIFTYSPTGKPKLECDDAFFVNWTHSQERFILAITNSGELGIDLEYARPLRNIKDLVSRFFSSREHELFMSLSESQRCSAFYRMWTLKECALKADAGSIASNLNDLQISPCEPALILKSAFSGSHFHGAGWNPEVHIAFTFTKPVHRFPILRWTQYTTHIQNGRACFSDRQIPPPINIRLLQ